MKIISLCLAVSALICLTDSSKILIIFPVPGKSHFMLGSTLAKGLAEAGHDITLISPFAEKTPPKNGTYREIILTKVAEEGRAQIKTASVFDRADANVFLTIPFMISRFTTLATGVFEDEGVQQLLNSDETFDAVIIEMFVNPVFAQFASRFKAAFIMYSPVGSNTWINHYVGNPANPSSVTNVFLPFSGDMSFCERLQNTLLYLYETLLFNFQVLPTSRELSKKYFPNEPDFEESLYNPSVVLLNSHVSTTRPSPFVPNMVEIGGYHIQPPKELPDDLKKFLDEASDGVIYFSMGSNLKSADMSKDIRKILLDTFSKLKQKVLWKFESDDIQLPPNVMIKEWLPQNDILAHKNVKLFITHGGISSTTETIYHGVPVLAISVFGDQKTNAQAAVSSGFGLSIPYKELTEEKFSTYLNELLNNPKFRENAKQRSNMFRDRIATPIETAIYWVEYAIRNPNSKQYLKVAGVNLPWYKYFLLDVLAFVATIILISCYIFVKIFKKLCCRKSKSKKQEKVKKN